MDLMPIRMIALDLSRDSFSFFIHLSNTDSVVKNKTDEIKCEAKRVKASRCREAYRV